eukprot:9907257-Karenia_brevis.AAC.1
MLNEMRREGLLRHMISLSTAISAREKRVQWQRVAQLLNEKRRGSLSVGVISFNAAIAACK